MYGNSIFRLGRLSSKINHYVNANIPKSIWLGLLQHHGQEGFAGKTVVNVIRLGKYAEDCNASLICLTEPFQLDSEGCQTQKHSLGSEVPFWNEMPSCCPTDERCILKDPIPPSDKTTGSDDALGYQATHEQVPVQVLQFCTMRWRSSNRLTEGEMCGLQCRQL